jgi:hypothetical protein
MRNGLVYKSTGDGRWQDSKDLLITGVFKGGENHRLAWSGTTYVALQERGWGSVLGTSKDGYAWTHKTFEGYNRLYDSLIWNGKVFVAAGYGSVTVSADGSNWQFVSLRNGKAPIRDALSIAGSNGNTILVSMAQEEQKSNERKPASFIAVLLGSADGLAWQGVLDGASLPKLGSGREYVFSEVTTKTLTELEDKVGAPGQYVFISCNWLYDERIGLIRICRPTNCINSPYTRKMAILRVVAGGVGNLGYRVHNLRVGERV